MPTNGTNNKNINEIIKITKENFKSFSLLIEENAKIMINPKKIKKKCLKKKE